MQQVLHDAGINPHLVPDLASRISTAMKDAQTPDRAKPTQGSLAAPNTPPPAFALPTGENTSGSTQLQDVPPPLEADAIIEAARLEAAKEKEAADAASQEAADKATAEAAMAAGLAEAPPLPPAAVIMALAQPGSVPATLPATLLEGTQPMAADSCLKRTAEEEAAIASEEPAKRLRDQ
eukprot:6484855-Amphidinium_carterae.1